MPSQPRLELVLPQDDLLSPASHPPKPGLGYLCPSPGQVPKKKFLSPGRRLTALTGRQAGPGWWQAPFFILLVLLLCIRIRAFKCVNVSAAWQPRFRLFLVFFWRENPARQRAPPILRSKVLGTKNVLKKFVPQRGQSTRRGQ